MSRLVAAIVVASTLIPTPGEAQALPGSALWEEMGDPAADMVASIGRFLDRELLASVGRRRASWERDLAAGTGQPDPLTPARERLAGILGAIGPRVALVEVSYVATTETPAKVAETDRYTAYAVRWSVYPGVEAEGLLLEPKAGAKADVVAMADCAVTPEQFVGLAPGLPPVSQVPRALAEAGCRVLVPTLIDRSDEFSGSPLVRFTNLPHREWIYRMAFEAGRHIIGYEVDKVRAGVDWLARTGRPKRPIGVMGHGEGGLIALHAAAIDPRIDAAWVSGFFGPREQVWRETIDRDVWGLLDQFGDAEVARMLSPRPLLIEASRGPEVAGPPPPRGGRSDAASGRLTTPKLADVRAEFDRIGSLDVLAPAGPSRATLTGSGGILNEDGRALRSFAATLGLSDVEPSASDAPKDARPDFDPRARMKRQVQQLVDYTQSLLRTSELRRAAYWSKADASSPERWAETIEAYRDRFWDEVIGRFPEATEPLSAKTRQTFDEPRWTGYAVQLPVWPDVAASGVLLLPKDLKPGERRPVVVCQHGLEGTPEPVVNPRVKSVYNSFGAQLADRGYIVYAPQNPYIGVDRFRILQRKAHPLKKSLFSVIVRQHEQTLRWLATLPQVDPSRIAFYGLSYGGKTAMRVPALLKGYCLSICSADFNEWVVKCTNTDRSYSYLYTIEYDMYEFGLSEGFNYAEMAALIAPRPFQVERGHLDGVAPDEWVGYEYAKVRRLYAALKIPDRTDIAYFPGGHMIDGKGTFAFLAKHLNWPAGR
jgi:dienelactone hydrolase